jgi:hypothetical protein
MPPQQGYALPDFVDEFFGFRAHGWIGLSIKWSCKMELIESARNIGMWFLPVKR